MFIYKQKTGELFEDAVLLGRGYAGYGPGVNNPAMQNVRNVGPIPVGRYAIGEGYNHPMLGLLAIPLTPDPANVMFGRSAFYMHGRKTGEKSPTSSKGCIIQDRPARNRVAAVRGTLQVVAA